VGTARVSSEQSKIEPLSTPHVRGVGKQPILYAWRNTTNRLCQTPLCTLGDGHSQTQALRKSRARAHWFLLYCITSVSKIPKSSAFPAAEKEVWSVGSETQSGPSTGSTHVCPRQPRSCHPVYTTRDACYLSESTLQGTLTQKKRITAANKMDELSSFANSSPVPARPKSRQHYEA